MDIDNMDVWFLSPIRTLGLACICAIAFFYSSTIHAGEEQDLIETIQRLDLDVRTVSDKLYQSAATTTSPTRTDSFPKLRSMVDRALSEHDSFSAIRILYNNAELLLDNYDSRSVFDYLELLLNNNEWNLSGRISEKIESDGDKSLIAMSHFIFAKYYARRNDWNNVYELLDGNYTDLSKENSAYSYLLGGVALQHMRKHREAIDLYKHVPADSKFYPQAQLNIATASVRQGWWTDADIIIKKLTLDEAIQNNQELINRLHLVLGYALIDHEFYRNARDEFRKISLDSIYTNRALLGLGLTAISQGDYIGGLNALNILKEKRPHDLSVDEAYLLLPYVYAQLKQEVTVTASYSAAINYYQTRITSLESLINNSPPLSTVTYSEQTNAFIINDDLIDYGQNYPISYIDNYYLLVSMSKHDPSTAINTEIQRLLNRYDDVFKRILSSLLEQRITYLKSYLSQSRYGLAKTFDDRKGSTAE